MDKCSDAYTGNVLKDKKCKVKCRKNCKNKCECCIGPPGTAGKNGLDGKNGLNGEIGPVGPVGPSVITDYVLFIDFINSTIPLYTTGFGTNITPSIEYTYVGGYSWSYANQGIVANIGGEFRIITQVQVSAQTNDVANTYYVCMLCTSQPDAGTETIIQYMSCNQSIYVPANTTQNAVMTLEFPTSLGLNETLRLYISQTNTLNLSSGLSVTYSPLGNITPCASVRLDIQLIYPP